MTLEFVAQYLILFLSIPIFVSLMFSHELAFKAIIALLLTWAITLILKEVTNRPRPYIRSGRKPLLNDPPTDKSFPSGHTSASMSVAVSLFYFNPILGFLLALLALAIGTSRVIAHVHSLNDIIFGAILGSGISLFVMTYL